MGPGPQLDGSPFSSSQAADDRQLDLGLTKVLQQSSGTLLVTPPRRTSTAGVGGECIQKSHPKDSDCAGHCLAYGLQTPGTDKVGGPALAQEARYNLPQLTSVDPSETQPALVVSLQQFRGQPAKALPSECTRGPGPGDSLGGKS